MGLFLSRPQMNRRNHHCLYHSNPSRSRKLPIPDNSSTHHASSSPKVHLKVMRLYLDLPIHYNWIRVYRYLLMDPFFHSLNMYPGRAVADMSDRARHLRLPLLPSEVPALSGDELRYILLWALARS